MLSGLTRGSRLACLRCWSRGCNRILWCLNRLADRRLVWRLGRGVRTRCPWRFGISSFGGVGGEGGGRRRGRPLRMIGGHGRHLDGVGDGGRRGACKLTSVGRGGCRWGEAGDGLRRRTFGGREGGYYVGEGRGEREGRRDGERVELKGASTSTRSAATRISGVSYRTIVRT